MPCTSQGKEYTEHDDMFVDNPNELMGKDLHFMVKILGCRGLPSRFNVSTKRKCVIFNLHLFEFYSW